MITYRKALIVVITLALLLCMIEASPGRLNSGPQRGNENRRIIRAPYRNSEISTARGFGKRDTRRPETSGKNYDLEGQFSESVPIEWMTDELATNPALTRVILRRFVDANQDGLLSAKELMATPIESNENY